MTALAGQLDWDRYTGFLAMEASLAHWDSYSYDLSNYRFYHEPTEDECFARRKPDPADWTRYAATRAEMVTA